MSSRVLYISYDGMLEPLGQSQVLAYQEKLSKHVQAHLVSFEKRADWDDLHRRRTIADRIRAAGITWHPCRYHKRPSSLATAYDIFVGVLTGLWLIRKHRLDIVHARSYVPAVMALLLKKITGARFIFDMRGFWADERVDGGLWPPGGRMYRVAKWFERHFLLQADHVISLTYAAVTEMQSFPYLCGRMPQVTVIPTCADLVRFKPAVRPPSDSLVLGYVGSAGTWYLFDRVAQCFALLLRMKPDAKFLIVNRGEHSFIRDRLDAAGVPATAYDVLSATYDEVPLHMARMHAGIFFIKPAFSKQASAPTKLAEFLGCGLPCLANAGVGDMAQVLETDRVGVAIRAFDEDSMAEGVKGLLTLLEDSDIRNRCAAAAADRFSLNHGAYCYARVYERVAQIT